MIQFMHHLKSAHSLGILNMLMLFEKSLHSGRLQGPLPAWGQGASFLTVRPRVTCVGSFFYRVSDNEKCWPVLFYLGPRSIFVLWDRKAGCCTFPFSLNPTGRKRGTTFFRGLAKTQGKKSPWQKSNSKASTLLVVPHSVTPFHWLQWTQSWK